jgi:succinoglycan biosynthesis transport protein ExoP
MTYLATKDGQSAEARNTQPRGLDEADYFVAQFREAVATVWRRKLLVVSIVALALALAAGLILNAPPVYRSAAQILLDPRGLQVSANDVLPQAFSSDIHDTILDTNIRLMSSTTVLEQVVRANRLQDDPEFVPGPSLPGQIKRMLTGEERREFSEEERVGIATYLLLQSVRVSREARSYILTAEVRTNDPHKSAAIASSLVDAFMAEAENRRRRVIGRARESITVNLESQRLALEEAERAVEAYRERLGIVDEDGRTLNAERLRELNRQILTARQEVQDLRSRIQQTERLRDTPEAANALETIESPLLNQLRTTLTTVTRERDNLRATLGPLHPQVREIETQVASTREALAQESTRTIAVLRSDYENAQSNLASLEADLEALEERTTRTNASLVGLRDLERDAEATRSVFNTYLERERELREQEAIAAESMTLITEARVPAGPVGLRPIFLLVAAVMFGGLAGVGAALARERLDGRVHSANALALRTGIPVLGVLPLRASLRKAMRHHAGLLVPDPDARGARSSRVIHNMVDRAESAGESDHTVTLLIAPSPSSGLDVIGLAMALTQSEEALLLDADASPRLGAAMDRLPDGSQHLTTASFEEYPSQTLHMAPAQHLRDPARLQSTLGYRSLTAACTRYPRVVALAGSRTREDNLRLLAEQADAIILLIDIGQTRFDDLDATRLVLGRHAGKVLGAVAAESGRDPVIALSPSPARVTRIAAE